jgi:hypothetical protein
MPMNVARMLRRAVRQVISRKSEARKAARGSRIFIEDIEDELRIMSDEEFAEYLRLHSKSHRWKA